VSTSLSTFTDILSANRAGDPVAVYSVCSSHPYAIRAALLQAAADGTIAVVESTSNQVNQLGGYTGMRPLDFVALVRGIAEEVGLPMDRVLLGGDHLGPFPWHAQPSSTVLPMAAEMVDEYVAAGFSKIHLDVSMYLGDDERIPGEPLSPRIVAVRTAELCAAAERSWQRRSGGADAPIYIVGNEVPVPGGTSTEQGELRPSAASDVLEFVESMEREFRSRGLEDAWERVLAVVVQPGVEFGDNLIHEYAQEAASELVSLVPRLPGLVYEAHSTDYQLLDSLQRLVADHFGILKVGPALTFAFREAVAALEEIEKELMKNSASEERSNLFETVVRTMKTDDRYWRSYYQGAESDIELALRYSFSDRIRYYWSAGPVDVAFGRLMSNLRRREIPLTLLSLHLPLEYRKLRDGSIGARPEELILSHIMDVTQTYSSACLPHR